MVVTTALKMVVKMVVKMVALMVERMEHSNHLQKFFRSKHRLFLFLLYKL